MGDDIISRGGGAAVAVNQEKDTVSAQREGGAFLRRATSGQGPHQQLESGWTSRPGVNPEVPAGVGPGVGSDSGEARGLDPPGEVPSIREILDNYSSSQHDKRVTVNVSCLDGDGRSHGYDS